MRKGFTLPEIMVATAISAIVLAAVCNFFIGAQRMMKLTLAQSELAIQSRALREQLLFHAGPSVGGSSGLLSATDVTLVGAAKSRLDATLPRFANGSVATSENLSLDAGPVRLTDIAFDAPGDSMTASNRFFVTLSGQVTVGGLVVRHDERVAVPLFGRTQPSDPNMESGL